MVGKIDYSATKAYHGSQFRIEEFSEEFIGKGNDQLGSGFYCTTGEVVARGYIDNDESPLIMVLNNLANDFYPDDPAKFNHVAFNILGYDSVIEHFQNESNICVWLKDDIEILSRETIPKRELGKPLPNNKFYSNDLSI